MYKDELMCQTVHQRPQIVKQSIVFFRHVPNQTSIDDTESYEGRATNSVPAGVKICVVVLGKLL
jgi:hypothetical protein